MNGNSRLRRTLLSVALTAAGIGGTLTAGAGTAQAASVGQPTVADYQWHQIVPQNSGFTPYSLDVSGASQSAGAPVIQWWHSGNANQLWQFVWNGDGDADTFVVNQNSGMCLNTDGVPGDQLTQQPCDGRAGELWGIAQSTPGYYTMRNPASQLYAEVYQQSQSGGASIDAWWRPSCDAGGSCGYDSHQIFAVW